MKQKALQTTGIVFIVVGIACNQWSLSLAFPAEGFHVAGLLEKSLGKWGLASVMLIWTVDLLFIGLGSIILKHHRAPKKIFFTVSIAVVSLIVSLGVLELLMRLVSPPNMFSPFLPLRPHNKMELHVDLSGVSAVARNTTNQWGLRGDEPPADWKIFFTVIVIGGSTAQCYYLDDNKTWPYLLQEELKRSSPNTWVGNGGISGHSSRAHILFVREVISKIKPNVALLLVGANDLWYSTNDEAQKTGNPAERTGWKYSILGYSRLVQVVFLWKIILFDKVVVLDRSANADFSPEPLDHEMDVPDNLFLLVPALAEYGKNIRTIISDLNALHVRPIFLTQPLRFDSSKAWKSVAGWDYSINGKKGKLSAATYAKLMAVFNQELIHICETEHVEVMDLASKVPHSGDFFYDAMHFNEKGAALVADTIAAYIRSHP